MQNADPFADSAFVARLQKLLSMMGSGQAGEADTARRKLLEHLSQQNMTMLDLAQRLDGARRGDGGAGHAPSFTGGVRDMSVERQMALAKAARDEATAEARLATTRLQTIQIELQKAESDMLRAERSELRTRMLALSGWVAAVLLLLIVVFKPSMPFPSISAGRGQVNMNHDGPVLLEAAGANQNNPTDHLAQGERAGTAAVQDMAIRLGPSPDASVRAFLTQGEPVAILQQVRVGPQTWLLLRTASGTGWARASEVMH